VTAPNGAERITVRARCRSVAGEPLAADGGSMKAETGGTVRVERPPARPGWVVVTVQRRRGPRRLWLALDEAAIVHAALGRVLPPVLKRDAAAGPAPPPDPAARHHARRTPPRLPAVQDD
jgi:hypothetical protein